MLALSLAACGGSSSGGDHAPPASEPAPGSTDAGGDSVAPDASSPDASEPPIVSGPSTGKPGPGHPAPGQPGTSTPDGGTPIAGVPDSAAPGAEKPGTDEANADRPSTNAPAEVSATLRAVPSEIGEGQSARLEWSSTGADHCTATRGWSGARAASGTENTPALSKSTRFQLECTGPGGSQLVGVKVDVLTRTISWVPPTENQDGTPLDDLAGYTLHWGTRSGDYSDSHRIESAGATEWKLTMPAGRYFFALTAFDEAGNESDYSNELQKNLI